MAGPTGRFRVLASDIVENAPGNQGREAIISYVEKRLEALNIASRAEGAFDAREKLLQEQLQIVRGLEQDAHARVRLVELELMDLKMDLKKK